MQVVGLTSKSSRKTLCMLHAVSVEDLFIYMRTCMQDAGLRQVTVNYSNGRRHGMKLGRLGESHFPVRAALVRLISSLLTLPTARPSQNAVYGTSLRNVVT